MQSIFTASLGAGFINQTLAHSFSGMAKSQWIFCLKAMSPPVETHSKSTCAELISQSYKNLHVKDWQ